MIGGIFCPISPNYKLITKVKIETLLFFVKFSEE